MNSASTPPNQPSDSPENEGAGLNLDDVLYTLFRHKWLLLGSFCMGIVAVFAVRIVHPPSFTSHTKLMIHYIEDRPPTPTSQDAQIRSPDADGPNLLNTEKELIRTLDVATNVAAMIGPERLLRNRGSNLLAAAGVVCGGLEVEVPFGEPILDVKFKSKQKDLVQPVVAALIEAYKRKHQEVHGGGALDDFYRQEANEMRQKLADTEKELKEIQTREKLISVDQAKRNYQAEIAKWQDELHTVQVELDARKSVLGDAARTALSASGTNTILAVAPPEKVKEYGEIAAQLENLKRTKEQLRVNYTEAYPTVMKCQGQIDRLTTQKADLEKLYPTLSHIEMNMAAGTTNSAAGEMAGIQRLNAQVASITLLLSNLTAGAEHVLAVEPILADLQRQRDIQETNYYRYSESLDRQRAAQELSGGKPVNISIIEQPTPPELDKKKMMKILGGAFAFCVFLGLLLAFLIDFVLDRTLRRPVEVQRRLKEDVFLTIPDIHWDRTSKYPPILRRLANGTNGHLPEGGTMAMEKFRPEEALAEHAAGLGERVITYFELNELSMKKPRMVGLAGCHHGAGVSSLASGLAAALSRSIQGNVLLVNLNRATNTAVSFQQGEEGKDLPRFLADRSEGAPDENNGRTHGTNGSGGNGHPGHALAHASHFVQMVPELTASEYDYIVFDMPPITPTSTTPRLSSQMDLMLMVLESEKTRQESGVRARSLLQESKTRVKTILNKYRTYVPAGLSSDAQG